MKNKELAGLLLQNPDNEVLVLVLVKGKWYLLEDIKEVTNNTSNNMTAIVINNPEIKVDE